MTSSPNTASIFFNKLMQTTFCTHYKWLQWKRVQVPDRPVCSPDLSPRDNLTGTLKQRNTTLMSLDLRTPWEVFAIRIEQNYDRNASLLVIFNPRMSFNCGKKEWQKKNKVVTHCCLDFVCNVSQAWNAKMDVRCKLYTDYGSKIRDTVTPTMLPASREDLVFCQWGKDVGVSGLSM